MDDKPTGGKAFPLGLKGSLDLRNPTGMTLRDYFAAHAPITMLDARQVWEEAGGGAEPTGRELISVLAKLRLAYADAMLVAREAS